MSQISVLLVDDHAVVRQGLRALLEMDPDITVVGEAENGWQAVALAREHHPGVVVMDVAMPLLNGADATRQILKEARTAKVLALTSYGDDACVQQMMDAGARGFLVKQAAAGELLKALREVSRGNAFFSPSIARRLKEHNRLSCKGEQRTLSPLKAELSGREAEVLRLIVEGLANKQIAAHLGISIKTVEKHRQQVMNKLDIHDVAGLTRHAVLTGFIGRELNAAASAPEAAPPVSANPEPAEPEPQPVPPAEAA